MNSTRASRPFFDLRRWKHSTRDMGNNPNHIEELEGEIRRQKRRLVKTHQYTKKLLLLSEELGPDGKTYFQVIKEHRDAHEHMMRALNTELTEADPERALTNILSNLKSTHAHEVRAFYDIADYMGLIIRDNIAELLGRFEHEAIGYVIPEYHEEWRSKILSFEQNIAEIRGGKDIATIERDDGNDIDTYHGIVVELVDIWSEIDQKQSEGLQRLKALSLLEQATSEMADKYSKEVILDTIPEYFQKVVPELQEKARVGDIEGVKQGLEGLAKYRISLKTAHRMEQKKIAGDRRFTVKNLILAAILALLGGLLIAYVTFPLQQAPEDRGSPARVEDSGTPRVVEQLEPDQN